MSFGMRSLDFAAKESMLDFDGEDNGKGLEGWVGKDRWFCSRSAFVLERRSGVDW